MKKMDLEETVRLKFSKLKDVLGEKQKRLWAAVEAESLGHSGVSIVQRATGLSRQTIHTGIKELKNGIPADEALRMRRSGGGRKTIDEIDPQIKDLLKKLVEDDTRGDPMRTLLWTNKSTSHLAKALSSQGHQISDRTVARLLNELGYSLQTNQKALEGIKSEERNSQFEYINERVKEFQENAQPVISIDTKKKELVGNFKNSGQEWRPKGNPRKVNVHDFAEAGNRNKAIPYGIYDITWNTGWVNVGTDHDTAEFAVESIKKWWEKMGVELYPKADRLMITCDSGGSNSSRGLLWKSELQKLADITGLEITVCHLPPGTSKWNKIEHKLFCHITKNWKAKPLTSYETIVNLISHTTTKKGLKVQAELDDRKYEIGKKPPKKEIASLLLVRHEINPRWNYTLSPRRGVCDRPLV
jgi:transposase